MPWRYILFIVRLSNDNVPQIIPLLNSEKFCDDTFYMAINQNKFLVDIIDNVRGA